MKGNVDLVSFGVHGDERGALIALENERDFPFNVKRVYYIYNTKPDVSRGFHAHKKLKQLLISVSGSVKVCCEYNSVRETFLLDSPDKGLLIEGLVWREMHEFSEDCVLVVLASEYYSEDDYIRDYEVFKQESRF